MVGLIGVTGARVQAVVLSVQYNKYVLMLRAPYSVSQAAGGGGGDQLEPVRRWRSERGRETHRGCAVPNPPRTSLLSLHNRIETPQF